MDNPIVSWLFETDAVRVCPEGQPFWYTSGKLGPFYINTQFLYGSEAAANALLSVIEEACAGDKLAFYGKVYGEIEKQLAACPIYHQLIDLMCEAARSMDVDFVSGGERRDFFFSMPVARRLGLGHLSIFKDLGGGYDAFLGELLHAADGHSEKLRDDLCPIKAAFYFSITHLSVPPPRKISAMISYWFIIGSPPTSRLLQPSFL